MIFSYQTSLMKPQFAESLIMTHVASLRFFLDTAELAQWEKWLPTGLFYGVTTNPVLLKAAGVACTHSVLRDLAREAFHHGAQEVQIQTWGRTTEAYLENARELAIVDPRVVIKVPTNEAGIVAAKILIGEGIRVTLTAVYTPAQALLASVLGASYSAPYLGRMNDAARDGFGDISAMQKAVGATGSATRILVASLRGAGDVARLAAEGLDTFTFSPKVAESFFSDELATAAIEAFEVAAEGAE